MSCKPPAIDHSCVTGPACPLLWPEWGAQRVDTLQSWSVSAPRVRPCWLVLAVLPDDVLARGAAALRETCHLPFK